jgi:hypothetical protein
MSQQTLKLNDPYTCRVEISPHSSPPLGYSPHVLSVRDRIQVFGVDTRLHLAGVVKFQSFRNRAIDHLPRVGMRRTAETAADLKQSVSARLNAVARPQPASVRLGDKTPEALVRRQPPPGLYETRVAVKVPTLPVLVAPVSCADRQSASVYDAPASHVLILRVGPDNSGGDL